MHLFPSGEINISDSDLAEEIDASERDGDAEDEVKIGGSERTIRRAECELVQYLPLNIFDSTKLFLKMYQRSSGASFEIKTS